MQSTGQASTQSSSFVQVEVITYAIERWSAAIRKPRDPGLKPFGLTEVSTGEAGAAYYHPRGRWGISRYWPQIAYNQGVDRLASQIPLHVSAVPTSTLMKPCGNR